MITKIHDMIAYLKGKGVKPKYLYISSDDYKVLEGVMKEFLVYGNTDKGTEVTEILGLKVIPDEKIPASMFYFSERRM